MMVHMVACRAASKISSRSTEYPFSGTAEISTPVGQLALLWTPRPASQSRGYMP